VNRLGQTRKLAVDLGPLRTAKFTPAQAVSRSVQIKKPAPAYIHGRPVWRVSQMPGIPFPIKVAVYRGGVEFDDCVLIPFPFSTAIQAWLLSQAASWSTMEPSPDAQGRVFLILQDIDQAHLTFSERRD
jgi:hypothetical protein